MKLSKHFTLEELSATNTKLPNRPPREVVERLRALCEFVLEPVRAHYGRPVIIHSGYRSPAVNAAIKGSKTSQHMKGEAADFHVEGRTVYEVATWLSETFEVFYDQLILENYVPNNPASGWVHCSYRSHMNRNESLTKFRGSSKYYEGILSKPGA